MILPYSDPATITLNSVLFPYSDPATIDLSDARREWWLPTGGNLEPAIMDGPAP